MSRYSVVEGRYVLSARLVNFTVKDLSAFSAGLMQTFCFHEITLGVASFLWSSCSDYCAMKCNFKSIEI